jgi:hypothetical protein
MKRSLLLAALVCAGPAHAQLSVSEVFYDAVPSDDGLEWIELWNEGDTAVDLSAWSLGWGGATYLSGQTALSGVIAPGERFVVGGPESSADNASPTFDLAVDLEADLQNSGATADGVALFASPVEAVTDETLPVSVVLYGEENASGLVDPTGAVAAVDVADAPAGHSIELGLDHIWRVQPAPTPGAPPQPVPEPGRAVLAAAGAAAVLSLRADRRRAGGGPSARTRSAVQRR